MMNINLHIKNIFCIELKPHTIDKINNLNRCNKEESNIKVSFGSKKTVNISFVF